MLGTPCPSRELWIFVTFQYTTVEPADAPPCCRQRTGDAARAALPRCGSGRRGKHETHRRPSIRPVATLLWWLGLDSPPPSRELCVDRASPYPVTFLPPWPRQNDLSALPFPYSKASRSSYPILLLKVQGVVVNHGLTGLFPAETGATLEDERVGKKGLTRKSGHFQAGSYPRDITCITSGTRPDPEGCWPEGGFDFCGLQKTKFPVILAFKKNQD